MKMYTGNILLIPVNLALQIDHYLWEYSADKSGIVSCSCSLGD